VTGDDPRALLALALADDEHVLGTRHIQWTGVAPHLEEDLAFSSIGQDEIGHGAVWYGLAAERTGKDPDVLALGRAPGEYRHAVLVERPNGDWGYTIARHLLFDLAEDVRLPVLAGSSWQDLADATGALRREERYHLLHARAWLERLAAGPPQARDRLTAGLLAAFPEAVGLFEAFPAEAELLADGTLPVPSADLLARWRDTVAAELGPHGLEHVVDPAVAAPARGGRAGVHSQDFTELWDEMTRLYRADPEARW
jgi:ring-1,2-phenylacetyl-CoA epoxidase subunit PaaC